MTDDQDKELEQYLEGDSKPSSAYAELGDETPPPELDARILAAAEREVKVTGIDAQRSPPFKAFAWAAIVVLSFSLVLNIVFDEAELVVPRQVLNIGHVARDQVIQTDDLMSLPQQIITEMRSQKTRATRHH